MAVMCKACVTVEPVRSLGFFVPHLCHKIESRLIDRVQDNKPDRELQYALILLSEVISVRGGLPTAKTETNPILPYVEDICLRVLDKTLNLKQKDEYELAGGILEGLLYNLVHVRQVQIFPAQKTSPPVWVREEFKWAKEGNLDLASYRSIVHYLGSFLEYSPANSPMAHSLRWIQVRQWPSMFMDFVFLHIEQLVERFEQVLAILKRSFLDRHQQLC